MTEPLAAETTREGMRRARAAGALVSFDLNLRPALWPRDADARAQVWPALTLADLVKLSAEEFAWLAVDGEDRVLERLWQGNARLLVVTDGPNPLRWFHPDAEGELPAYRVPAVDTTAAGDAFVGGLLLQLAEQRIGAGDLDTLVATLPRLHATLRHAAAAAAIAVTRQGSFASLPTTDEVLAFMETHA
jgi:fructokinase